MTGLGIYPDGMVEHDGMVGQLLKKLDDLGIADNTIVIYTTDNGAEVVLLARWRHDAVSQREEHELGRRLSRARDGALARRDVKPHTEINGIFASEDWLPIADDGGG